MPMRTFITILTIASCAIASTSGAAAIQVLDQYRRVSAFDYPIHNQTILTDLGSWSQSDSISSSSRFVTASQDSLVMDDKIAGSSDLRHVLFSGSPTSDMIAQSELRVVFSIGETQLVKLSGTLESTSSAPGNIRVQLTSASPGAVELVWQLTDGTTSINFDEVIELGPGIYELQAYGYANIAPLGESHRKWSVDLQPIPEPSTIALLLLPTLALTNRPLRSSASRRPRHAS